MVQVASSERSEHPRAPFPWRSLLRVEVLPPLAAFLGSAWFASVVAGGGIGSWLAGLAFSAFVAALTAAVATSRWYRQWRARSRLRHLRRLCDEGLLTEDEVAHRRRSVLDGL